jgi:hypothetical protein
MYYDVIEVQKTPEAMSRKKKPLNMNSIVEPLKKIGFLANLFNKDTPSVEDHSLSNIRYLVIYEGRLLVMQEIPEQVRNYGSHFSVKDKDKLQMPRIT